MIITMDGGSQAVRSVATCMHALDLQVIPYFRPPALAFLRSYPTMTLLLIFKQLAAIICQSHSCLQIVPLAFDKIYKMQVSN